MINVKFILFVTGAGGNFLARALTLDPDTVSLGPEASTVEQRLANYRYDDKFKDLTYNEILPTGLSQWVDQELNHYYFPFTRGMEALNELNKTVIEPIHPHHYQDKINLLGPDDRYEIFWIDPTDCELWVQKQIYHKILQPNIKSSLPQQLAQLRELAQHRPSIKLINILKSNQSFREEYQRACDLLEIHAYVDQAEIIYNSWKQTWKTT